MIDIFIFYTAVPQKMCRGDAHHAGARMQASFWFYYRIIDRMNGFDICFRLKYQT